jgi:hypothetical protein
MADMIAGYRFSICSGEHFPRSKLEEDLHREANSTVFRNPVTDILGQIHLNLLGESMVIRIVVLNQLRQKIHAIP